MSFVLIAGQLFRAPENKCSKGGIAYTQLTIREGSGKESTFWTCRVFDTGLQRQLTGLGEGAALALEGRLSIETYKDKIGETKIAHGMIVDQILPLRREGERRK